MLQTDDNIIEVCGNFRLSELKFMKSQDEQAKENTH